MSGNFSRRQIFKANSRRNFLFVGGLALSGTLLSKFPRKVLAQFPAWQRLELAPAGSASTNGGITTVSRIPNSMEVWWIGANGSIQDANWYEGAKWQQFELAPAGSASTNGDITAVSRIPNSMEVWWIGTNRSVQDAYWYG